MKAYRIRELRAVPDLVDLPLPHPGQGEVLVRIAACGLNFADLLLMQGKYQDQPALPFSLGIELAGTVESLSTGATNLSPGQRVMVIAGHGGLAEFGCFPADRCIPIPDAMPFEHAAAFPVAYGTSHLALAQRAALRKGETLLVLGAAGGVGLTAVEIGKRLGARVIACARGADKLAVAVARAAGADHLIDSELGDLTDAVRALGRADVVYDPVGGDQFRAALRAVNPQARILLIGFASGDVPQIPANILLVKNVSVIGVNWPGYLGFDARVLTDSLATLLGWYAAGGLRPHVSHTLPLERAAEALEVLRSRTATGKIVVTMPG